MHPLQLLIVLAILISMLGPAALVGAALLASFMLVSTRIARRQVSARRALSRHTDERVGLMNEILSAIRVLKFYAWERSFAAEVRAVRGREVKELSRLARLSAIGALIFLSAPVVVAVATIGAFVLSGHPLVAADVFPALALFAVLRHAMVMLPEMVTSTMEANVAVQRIERFLKLDELTPRADAAHLPRGAVRIADATVEWTPGAPALAGIDMELRPGEYVAVVGSVGSGKSALISALLGDLRCASGVLESAGTMAYVSQQAWIRNGDVRENVIFGAPVDEARYKRALVAACLAPDLRRLPAGDATEIGERGVNLSGGQKQRLSLARAVYRDADIYLMDDPLSALDNEVGRAVHQRVLLGMLRGKTRVLATHRLEYADSADRVFVIVDGKIVESGAPAELKRRNSAYASLWRSYESGSETEHEPGGEAAAASAKVGAEVASSPEAATETPAETERTDGKLMVDEERNTGTVALGVYLLYLRAFAPGLLAAAFLAVFVAKEVSNAGTDSWLAWWTARDPLEVAAFLTGYLVLGILACATTFARSLAVSLRGLTTGTAFHDRLLGSVLRAPMSFFEGTPVGRILNRFSRDIEAVDQQIPRSVHESLGCVLNILMTLGVVVLVSPAALVAIVPVAVIYWRVQRVYRPSSREGQRLDSVTRSPIFALYAESLAGLPVIRAYGAGARFEKELLGYLTLNGRAFYTIVSANRWLGVRIETLGACVVACAAFTAVLRFGGGAAAAAGASGAGSAGIGFAGLAVTYALAITGAMNWAVRMFSQLESNLNSVERLDHYSRLTPERWDGAAPPAGWPARGEVVLDALELRYRPELPAVIRGVAATIKAGEKVGIVGRTGAGKSSLILGLFRVLEASSGRILIDGVDIGTLDLAALRSSLAVIPQDPVLFKGTLRKNLDPFAERTDDELWRALERAHLAPLVRATAEGLSSVVHEGGSNYSVGQRQLICLARAILKGSRVLLLDEATASVDAATDALIQRTIRTAFAGSTVLTIAHRLGTVLDADRVMVIDTGKLVEFDAPAVLARKHQGAFAALLRESKAQASAPGQVPFAAAAAPLSPVV
jgi:ABC-type multidrug transport system fused ATPase/permease subunit